MCRLSGLKRHFSAVLQLALQGCQREATHKCFHYISEGGSPSVSQVLEATYSWQKEVRRMISCFSESLPVCKVRAKVYIGETFIIGISMNPPWCLAGYWSVKSKKFIGHARTVRSSLGYLQDHFKINHNAAARVISPGKVHVVVI